MTLTFEYKPCTRSTKGDKFNHPSPPTSLCYLNNCPSPPYLLYSPGRFGKLSWLYFSTFTIDDVISFFGQELSYKILPKKQWNVCYNTTDINQKKRFSVKIPFFFVRIFDPCDEIVKCLGHSTNMKICFRHNRCQYSGFEYVIIRVVLNREMHRIKIMICYIPWFPFKQMSWKDS